MDSLKAAGSEELRALLVLDGTPGVGPATVRRLVDHFGSAVAALAAPHRAFRAVAGAGPATHRHDRGVRAEADAALTRAARSGISAVSWSDPTYPAVLHALADPPPVLFLLGRVELLGRIAVTVVGARRATRRARDLAGRLGVAMARVGVQVVSGLALGVDGAAHEGALDGGGDTVAVLGTGVDVVYPRAHARLHRRLVEHGLLVSEFRPGVTALPHHFPRRNRILAALGAAVVVVEAGARSGSLITVDHALDVGHEVWAVPGPIEREACVGSNALLAEGARPLLSIDYFVRSFVDAYAPVGVQPLTRAHGAPASGAVEGEEERRVFSTLDQEPRTCDEVARLTELDAAVVLGALTALELRGAVTRMPGMRFRRAA